MIFDSGYVVFFHLKLIYNFFPFFFIKELFKRVVPHQCLGAVWARRARKEGKGNTVAGSVLATIEQFNRVSLRVIATILKHTDLKTTQRVKIIQKWIEIAQVIIAT